MKRKLLSLLVCVSSVCLAMVAEAATATWTNPTDSDLAGVAIYRAAGACSNPGAFAKVNTFLKPAVSGTLTNPTIDGKYCHKATAFDTASNESVFTNTAEFDYNTNPPGAPNPFNGSRPNTDE